MQISSESHKSRSESEFKSGLKPELRSEVKSQPKIDNHHLVTVWNPGYKDDAMAEHLKVISRYAATGIEDDIYVWWGKIRSPNKLDRDGNYEQIRSIMEQLQSSDREVQLYITDYRSLYVANVEDITEDDVREDDGEHVPPYYLKDSIQCDFWFLLTDIRRLVYDDLPAVITELGKLRNVNYHNKPVSLYGGIVRPPLIVTRPDGERFFDEAAYRLTDGKRWVRFDSDNTISSQISASIRDDMLGEAAWYAFSPSVRTFLGSGESIFRAHRQDPGFDFSGAMICYAKAVEVHTISVLRQFLAKASPDLQWVKVHGNTESLLDHSPTLGALEHVLSTEENLIKALASGLHNGVWFSTQFPPILRQLAGVRNAGAHREVMELAPAIRLRNQLMGVGPYSFNANNKELGVFPNLALCTPRRPN